VRGREYLIHPSWEEELYRYITGIVQNKEQKMLAINGMPDHLHIFLGMRPTCCLSDLVREIKKSSNSFINDRNLSAYKFRWQEGFGAFSYAHRDVDRIVRYILNQKEHHRKQNFRKEYDTLLAEFEISPHEKYHKEWFDQCGLEAY